MTTTRLSLAALLVPSGPKVLVCSILLLAMTTSPSVAGKPVSPPPPPADSGLIEYADQNWRLFLRDLGSSTTSFLIQGRICCGHRFSWSHQESPRWVVYDGGAKADGTVGAYAIREDGSNNHPVVLGANVFALSPDDRSLVFGRYYPYQAPECGGVVDQGFCSQLLIQPFDVAAGQVTGSETPLSPPIPEAADIRWSPDGLSIAVRHYKPQSSTYSNLYRVDLTFQPDGTFAGASPEVNLTADAPDLACMAWSAATPAWPRGRIVFSRPVGKSDTAIYHCDAFNTSDIKLVISGVGTLGLDWSPDAKRIVYDAIGVNAPGKANYRDIFAMFPDGTGISNLTSTSSMSEAYPSWRPAVFEDCNANGLNDSLDIARGTSADADHNSIPDECQ